MPPIVEVLMTILFVSLVALLVAAALAAIIMLFLTVRAYIRLGAE